MTLESELIASKVEQTLSERKLKRQEFNDNIQNNQIKSPSTQKINQQSSNHINIISANGEQRLIDLNKIYYSNKKENKP